MTRDRKKAEVGSQESTAHCLLPTAYCLLPTALEERLALDTYLRRVGFVTFVLYSFLGKRAKSLFVSILRRLAMAADHLLARLNPD